MRPTNNNVVFVDNMVYEDETVGSYMPKELIEQLEIIKKHKANMIDYLECMSMKQKTRNLMMQEVIDCQKFINKHTND